MVFPRKDQAVTVLAMSHGELSPFDTLLRVKRGKLYVDDPAVAGLKRHQLFSSGILEHGLSKAPLGPGLSRPKVMSRVAPIANWYAT